MAIELTQGLCATLGVVLTVPIATAVSASLFIHQSHKGQKAVSVEINDISMIEKKGEKCKDEID